MLGDLSILEFQWEQVSFREFRVLKFIERLSRRDTGSYRPSQPDWHESFTRPTNFA